MSRQSSPLPQIYEPVARTSSLFFSLPGKDAQKSRGHKHQRANSMGTGPDSGETSPEPDPSPPPPPPLPVQLDANAAAGIALAAFLLGSATALGASSAYRRFFKRIKNAEWITPDVLRRKRWITGIVTRYVLWGFTYPYRSLIPLKPPYWRCRVVRGVLFFFFGGGVAWVMRITSAFTIHLALAGAAYSSSGMCLPPIEVRDRRLPHHPTNNDPKPKFKSNVLQD